jgi:hypothetical protein
LVETISVKKVLKVQKCLELSNILCTFASEIRNSSEDNFKNKLQLWSIRKLKRLWIAEII